MADLIRVFNPKSNKVKLVTETVVKSGVLQKQGFVIQEAPKSENLRGSEKSVQLDLEAEAAKITKGSVAPVDLTGLNTAASIEKLQSATVAELESTLLVETRKGVKKHIKELLAEKQDT